jgi:hypothetical protein
MNQGFIQHLCDCRPMEAQLDFVTGHASRRLY